MPTLTDLSTIRDLCARYDFALSKGFGQNFIINPGICPRIAETAGIGPGWGALEVGPGIGCLTEQLAQRAGKVVSVELDERLRPVLAETLAGYENVELVFGDVLALDLPQLVAERFPGLRPVVCANLPYNVTSPLLTAFLTAGCFDTVTVMIQREVARRLCARPGTADYGALTVFVQWHAEPELLFDVPPSCFIPQPKVTSSVIRLRRREKPPVEVGDEKLMFRVIRAAFNQRRKTLVNALSSQLGVLDKENAARVLVNCGFDTKIRGETVDIVGFAKISDEISSIIGADL